MADLLVKRSVTRRDLLRRYVIEVDGTPVAHVRAGGTAHVIIAEGMRKVRLSIDGYSSRTNTVLASDRCIAILRAAPADIPEDRVYPLRIGSYLPADRAAYLEVKLERAADLAKAFVQAAWSTAHFQIQERMKPGHRSRYGLTPGDLSVLYHGCRSAGANMITSRGSANDRLWCELAKVGWLTSVTTRPTLSEAVAYSVTELGRTELLEVFSD